MAHFKLLRDRKVTAPAILAHFLYHHIAPLQQRPHPVWNYKGPTDPSHLDSEDMTHKLVQKAVARIVGARVKTKLPSGFHPLWVDPDMEEILASMLEFS